MFERLNLNGVWSDPGPGSQSYRQGAEMVAVVGQGIIRVLVKLMRKVDADVMDDFLAASVGVT